ncbi:MAG: helix-turn-helix transcriptional regulator, partial [Treponema sp.]|nr:helix-turn-helix transcriptional regulator [Treponema sp.]
MPADPVNQRFLERPRVGRLLAKALQSHVVTVVAGEGNGKTHAVSSFLQNEKQKMIWVQISEQDNLDWRFWENYTGAIARINPKAAKILADTGFPESDRRLDRHLSLLKSEIISPERYVTVFDDWQLLTNPKVLMRIEQMLTAPVSKNTIVFISRVEPVMNTVNLLAKGLLSQITVEDLRFTREETAAYFRLYDIVLEKEELDRIFQKTEGWALALGLMLQGVKDGEPGGPKWDRMMRPIREMEEAIFSAMEPDLQKFLIKLSLIGHWPRKLLEDLDPERKNMAAMETFSSVIRFDPYLDGFRIHRSFLEFLQEKQSRLPREEIRELYDKDAQWCIENKLPIAAAVNYEQAGDCGGFVRIVDSLPRMLPRTMAAFFLETAERLIVANMEDPLFR